MRDPDPSFWDRIAKRYAKSGISNQQAYEEKLAKTRQYLFPEANVLEIGCGTGTTALQHAPLVNHILATDLSANMLAIAKQRAQDQSITNVTFEQRSVQRLDGGQDFDMVMAHSVLHLLPEPASAIRKAYDLLKPGGTFVSSTACLGDNMRYLKPIVPIGRLLRLMPEVYFLTRTALVQAVVATGFSIEHEWQPAPKEALFLIARKPVT